MQSSSWSSVVGQPTELEDLQLLKTYEEVAAAVAFVELFLCVEEGGEVGWDYIMEAEKNGRPITPEEVVTVIKGCIEESLPVGRREEALQQVDHPKFLQYICGKMGAV